MSLRVLLAHPATQHSYQLMKQLVRHNCLYQFWTGFALAQESWHTSLLQSTLPTSIYKKFANRIVEDVPPHLLRTIPWIELEALRQTHSELPADMIFHKRNLKFQRQISAKSIQHCSTVIGFDTSSWLLAKQAKDVNKVFFLDQSTPHPLFKESVLQQVFYRYPKWKEDLEGRSSEVYLCEQQEYELASKIVVASTYTKNSLITHGVPKDKIIINPYGVDLKKFEPAQRTLQEKPLRFLFLGAVNARKGIPLLLQAWQMLQVKEAELWLVGPIKPETRTLIPDLLGLKIKGRYPHEDLPGLMKQCDVLVFPSYFDGFALVLLEALATGLPIITTEATAGPDLISDGIEGFIIPTGNVDDLCAKMQFFIDNPENLDSMSTAARLCAERYTWDAYGDRWHNILRNSA